MSRALQLALGIVAVLLGIGLGVAIALIWRPCAGEPLPLEPTSAPACTALVSGTNTGWIGLLLWPVALAAAGFAVVRMIARGSGVLAWATAILLGLVTMLANPLPEYWLLNLAAKSWDEPPYTGALTALTFVLAGVMLLVTREQRVPAALD